MLPRRRARCGVTYVEYSPNVGTTVLRETNMNFALAPSAALLIFCAARYRGAMFRLLTMPAGAGARRGELLDISRALGDFDGGGQAACSGRARHFA